MLNYFNIHHPKYLINNHKMTRCSFKRYKKYLNRPQTTKNNYERKTYKKGYMACKSTYLIKPSTKPHKKPRAVLKKENCSVSNLRMPSNKLINDIGEITSLKRSLKAGPEKT